MPPSIPILPCLVFLECLSSLVQLLLSEEADHFPTTYVYGQGQEAEGVLLPGQAPNSGHLRTRVERP